jgi:hypothetical protein
MKVFQLQTLILEFPQIELWGHSLQGTKKITDRTRTEMQMSIYKTIYGGITQPDENDTERCRK